MNWYLAALRKYAVFEGRAQRAEYWMFQLVNTLVYLALFAVEWSLGGPGIVGSLYVLAALLPIIAVTVRRLHDTGRSGWWYFVILIPLINLVLLVFMVSDSQGGENHYGPNPKAPRSSPATRVCPYCAEEIEAAATVCRHCQNTLEPPATVSGGPAASPALPTARDMERRGPTSMVGTLAAGSPGEQPAVGAPLRSPPQASTSTRGGAEEQAQGTSVGSLGAGELARAVAADRGRLADRGNTATPGVAKATSEEPQPGPTRRLLFPAVAAALLATVAVAVWYFTSSTRPGGTKTASEGLQVRPPAISDSRDPAPRGGGPSDRDPSAPGSAQGSDYSPEQVPSPTSKPRSFGSAPPQPPIAPARCQTLPTAGEAWCVSSALAFQGGEPTAAFAPIVAALESPADDAGSSISAAELSRLLDDPRATEVYRSELIKYATPKSKKIQKAEHTSFISIFMKPAKIDAGVAFLSEHAAELDAARRRFGVVPQDVVSVLMWESNLGKATGKFHVFNLYVGQIIYLDEAFAYAEGESGSMPPGPERDAHLARLARIKRNAGKYLVALLRSAKAKGIDPLAIMGSWGGAIGFPQFMPTSFQYAADGDGDGSIDLYAFPDAIASIANYLEKHGYRASRTRAFHAYNPEDEYVRGVKLYADTIARESHTRDRR